MAENGLLPDAYGLADAGRWRQSWRMFFMACAELSGHSDSRGRIVSHYLFKKQGERC
jgi:cyclopropane-fatty-acyl-phospholipid synthase